MTRLITILIIVLAVFCGWAFYKYYEKTASEEDKAKVDTGPLRGNQLPGLPYQLETSLVNVQQAGTDTFRKWLKTYGDQIQDPRKAWIQLDFCVAVRREDVSEARRIFAEVKARTGPNSPVSPRVKELEKTFQ